MAGDDAGVGGGVIYRGRQSKISRAEAEWGNARLAAVQMCAVLLAVSDAGSDQASFMLRWVLSRFLEDHGVTFQHVVDGMDARWRQQENLRYIRGVTAPVSCLSPLDLSTFDANLRALGIPIVSRKAMGRLVEIHRPRMEREASGWLE